MRYHQLGEVPPKRHAQFRERRDAAHRGGPGLRGLLRQRVDPLPPVVAVPGAGGRRVRRRSRVEEWVPADPRPPAHRHRRASSRCGDPIAGRRRAACATATSRSRSASPTEEAEVFYRNGEGDEVVFVHEGSGVLETIFGRCPSAQHDYVVIPRGTTLPLRASTTGRRRGWCFHTPGEIETPNRYRNRYGQLLEHAPFSHRDFHPPAELETHRERGDFEVIVRVRGGYQRYVARLPPVRRRRLGRLRLPLHVQRRTTSSRSGPPPPAAAGAPDLPGPELRDLLVLPARARLGPAGRPAPLPPLEPAVRGGHLLRLRRLRLAQGHRDRLGHAAPLAACRTARSRGWWSTRWARAARRSWR